MPKLEAKFEARMTKELENLRLEFLVLSFVIRASSF